MHCKREGCWFSTLFSVVIYVFSTLSFSLCLSFCLRAGAQILKDAHRALFHAVHSDDIYALWRTFCQWQIREHRSRLCAAMPIAGVPLQMSHA